jgi:aspartate ammonia-lyase
MRTEKDALGQKQIPFDAYYGIFSIRSAENFPQNRSKTDPEFIRSYALVKKACLFANFKCGDIDETIFSVLDRAVNELIDGVLNDQVIVPALAGGAGTPLNMNINEIISNRALELLGKDKGDYSIIHPVNHVNMSQSTNDTYPTALKIALIFLIRSLHIQLEQLQQSLQKKESEFANVLKIGRTQLQDAVPMTLGMEFSAYAEAISRDRWRLYKMEERLRYVNIGASAIGTGLNTSKKYQFLVIEKLREITGIGLAKPENLIDITQNADVFAEISGLLKTCAVTLNKIANDLRLLSSGPICGFGEINLPEKQLGSSIMPFKINPVIAEAVNQVCFIVFGNDAAVTYACQAGQLELNAFLPVIADKMTESLRLLTNIVENFYKNCINGITVNENHCRNNVFNSYGIATILVPVLGYDNASIIVKTAKEKNISVRDAAVSLGLIDEAEIDEIFSNIHSLLRSNSV